MTGRMRVEMTLYGESAEEFQRIKERVSELRGGLEPSHPVVVRRLMENFDPSHRGLRTEQS